MSGRQVLHVERRTCPHCYNLVSLKTFKAHKRRFFDAVRGQWLKVLPKEGLSEGEESPPEVAPEPSTETSLAEGTPGNFESAVSLCKAK